MSLSVNVLHYGSETPLPPSRELRAGPLTLDFEEGELRRIRHGSHEVLRRIYAAVRDRNWDTIVPVYTGLLVDEKADSFEMSFFATCRKEEVYFSWKGTITGSAEGTIKFLMEGEAKGTFLRNRIGFCVLHPIRECAGRPCLVERTSGAVTKGGFPRYVWPHQPFQDIRAISHEVVPGVRARVQMDGDVFEMEDHRNWADASYKTYCTPLKIPFPVEVPKGTKIVQTVTLTLEGRSTPTRIIPPALPLSVGAASRTTLPRLGLCTAAHDQPPTARETGRLKALKLSHLRVDLRPFQPDTATLLRHAAAQARFIGASLEIALHLTDSAKAELQSIASLLGQVQPPIAQWLIFHEQEPSTTQKWILMAREALTAAAPKAKFGAGTNAYFAELNRGHPPKNLDLVCYSLNPQVHAFDNATLVENLEGMESTVESARLIAGDHPLALGPVTLRPRFNPYATGPAPETPPGELPPQVEPRQMSLFGAGWTVGSLRALAQPGVHSITYYETLGRLGVCEQESPPLHRRFPAVPGSVFPLYHVLADAGEFAGGSVLPWTTGNPLVVEGIALSRDGRVRILLANLTSKAQKVRLACNLLLGGVSIKRLDETTALQAMTDPEAFRAAPGEHREALGKPIELELLPYAVMRVDSPPA